MQTISLYGLRLMPQSPNFKVYPNCWIPRYCIYQTCHVTQLCRFSFSRSVFFFFSFRDFLEFACRYITSNIQYCVPMLDPTGHTWNGRRSGIKWTCLSNWKVFWSNILYSDLLVKRLHVQGRVGLNYVILSFSTTIDTPEIPSQTFIHINLMKLSINKSQ